MEPTLPRSPTEEDEVHYTVFVRLPFARGDFVDPPPIEWDSTKDRELWDVLSRASAKGRDLDWHALADRFNVTLSFLSQQAAWLYERQLSQVRAQLRKVNRPSSIGTHSNSGSATGSATAGSNPRGGSGAGSRVPSSLSHRPKERTASHGDEGTEAQRPIRGFPLSRNTSSNTVTRIRTSSPVPATRSPTETHQSFKQRRQSREASRRSLEASPLPRRSSLEKTTNASAIASDSSSSSSSESEALHPMSRSRAFARRPRYAANKAPLNPLSDADEDDEDSAPFLPFSDARPGTPPAASDPGATVRMSPKGAKGPSSHRLHPGPSTKGKAVAPKSPVTIHSSSSSAQSQPQSRHQHSQTPLSALSPRQRRLAKEPSDGTPSMGSSFSDLDDASVTQSALEEALANEMTHGGVASRMSTISQALRSRYL